MFENGRRVGPQRPTKMMAEQDALDAGWAVRGMFGTMQYEPGVKVLMVETTIAT